MSSLTTTRQGIRLSQILTKAKFLGADEIFVQSCCGHWKECQSSDLFVAIVGAEVDGHDYAQEAIKRGAKAVVTERLLSIDLPQCIVPDSRVAYAKICQALAGVPSQKLKTIGVSGSDGKTVTSHLIDQILRRAGKVAGLASSIKVDLGRGREAVPNRQVTSPQLADQLAQMAMASCDHAVLEFSSVALADRTLDGIAFDVVVLTNLRRSNLDIHGTTENYRRSQLRIFNHLKPGGVIVMNADDPVSHFLIPQLKSPCITIGIKQEAQLTAKVLQRSIEGQTFSVTAGQQTVVVSSRIIGDQHVYNCLSAIAVGLLSNISLPLMAQAISDMKPIPGRLEPVDCGQDFGLWIDSATTATQLATAMRAARGSVTGKLWCVCSIAADQTDTQRHQLGKLIEKNADRIILTNTCIESKVDYEPFHQVLDGLSRPGDARLIPNRFKAIEWVLTQAKPGDAVLITGCGERPFALIGDHQWTLSDRDVCEAWLYDQTSMLLDTPAKIASELDDQNLPQIYDIRNYRKAPKEN